MAVAGLASAACASTLSKQAEEEKAMSDFQIIVLRICILSNTLGASSFERLQLASGIAAEEQPAMALSPSMAYASSMMSQPKLFR